MRCPFCGFRGSDRRAFGGPPPVQEELSSEELLERDNAPWRDVLRIGGLELGRESPN